MYQYLFLWHGIYFLRQRNYCFQSIRQMQREYKAVHAMLVRSGLPDVTSICQLNHCRMLSTSCARLNQGNPSNPNNPNDSKDPSSEGNKDQNKKNNDEKAKEMMLKLAAWTAFCYLSTIWLLYFFTGKGSEEEEVSIYFLI